jgi:hypothetical protein
MTAAIQRIGLTLIFLIGAMNLSHAGVNFDVATDFSVSNNPNGAWSYGYSTTLAGPIILNAENGTTTGVDYWRTNINSGVPASSHNSTQNVVTLSTLQLQPGQFAFHPGPNNQYEKARLTVSTAGEYSVAGIFSGADTRGTTTDVHILLNGASIFDGSVNGFGPTTGPSFSFVVSLGTNDALDFAVGFGSNGNFFFDTTALAAQVTAVPEPSTTHLLGAGALLGTLALRRRAKASERKSDLPLP